MPPWHLAAPVDVVACKLARKRHQRMLRTEEGFYMLRPVNKTDHMCQDTKVLTKH